MKEIRKSKNNLFICEECDKTFKLKHSLSAHINQFHNGKEYYDKWLKEKDEGFCEICGKETQYSKRWDRGYKKTCSDNCLNKHLKIKFDKKNLSEKEIIKEKREKTNLERFKTKNPYSSKEIKEKIQATNMKNLGVLYPGQSNLVKEKIKKTFLKKFGYENPQQNPDIFKKTQTSQLKYKRYNNTDLIYQGSYELDFLENFYNLIEIKNAPYIKYKFNGVSKVYHPDFFIPDLNLIVEIKSSYYFNKYRKLNLAKEKSVINTGYKYLIIIDKNYTNFKNEISRFLTMAK